MMKVFTDTGMDLTPAVLDELNITVVPLEIELDGKRYKSGVDIDAEAFYRLLRNTYSFPVTSQPSHGDFVAQYEAAGDTDILSVHFSGSLSGTVNAARVAAQTVAEKGINVTVIDTKQASAATGWLVEVAGQMAQSGCTAAEIEERVTSIRPHLEIRFSPDTLKYLVHGGRVSHLRGLAASMLNLKPLFRLDDDGAVDHVGTVRTMKKALAHHVEAIAEQPGQGAKLRVQIIHADNLKGAQIAAELMGNRFECEIGEPMNMTALLGAHTGPGLAGMVYGPQSAFDA